MQKYWNLSFLVLAVALVSSAKGDDCQHLDGKKLLEGCSLLNGVSITSQGGTLVNDSNCDVLLPKLVFNKQPNVTYEKAEADKYYTVITLDPDAPKHPEGKFFLHMIKTNIPGSSISNGIISTGDDVTEYKGPNPPEGSGDHRYIFVVYGQKSKDLKAQGPESRRLFDVSEWMKDLPLCGPLGGVQFRSRYEL